MIKKKRKIPGPSNKEEEKKFGVQEVRGSVSNFERRGHTRDSQGQSMALALVPKPFKQIACVCARERERVCVCERESVCV